MRPSCQVVPSLVLLLLSAGCYRAHQSSGEPICVAPSGMICCDASGLPALTFSGCPFVCPPGAALVPERECRPDPPIDGGQPHSPIDGGLFAPDAGDGGALSCPLERGDATCLSSLLIEPGVAFELPVTFDACGCCMESECRVEVTSVDGSPTLLLTTALCPDACLCDRCIVPEARCAVPALEEGVWSVVVNGAPAFQVPVVRGGVVEPPAVCHSYAAPDMCSVSMAPLDAWGWRPMEVCVEPARVEHTVLTVSSDCWSCGDLHGTCSVRLEPRLTDDLPPGGELRLDPTTFVSACDYDCPATCVPAERHCQVPPLVPGHFYRVWSDGEPILTFVAGETDRLCGTR